MPWNTKLILSVLVGLTMSAAWAKEEKNPSSKVTPDSAQTADKNSDKVDITDLEKKYWAPKDTDFSVVQNRTYSKEGAFFISAQAGPIVNDHYSEGYIFGGTANYFFNERYGLQATYLTGDLKNNDPTNNLTNFGSGVQPDFGRFKNYYGLGFSFVPFYAKMSFLGSRILYFDMAVTPHVGMTSYDQILDGSTISKSSFTYGIDVTQYFFLTKNFAIRADLKNHFFNEEVLSYRGVSGKYVKGDKVRDQSTQFTTFLLGLTLYFK